MSLLFEALTGLATNAKKLLSDDPDTVTNGMLQVTNHLFDGGLIGKRAIDLATGEDEATSVDYHVANHLIDENGNQNGEVDFDDFMEIGKNILESAGSLIASVIDE